MGIPDQFQIGDADVHNLHQLRHFWDRIYSLDQALKALWRT